MTDSPMWVGVTTGEHRRQARAWKRVSFFLGVAVAVIAVLGFLAGVSPVKIDWNFPSQQEFAEYKTKNETAHREIHEDLDAVKSSLTASDSKLDAILDRLPTRHHRDNR